jgi:hypothetical protein
VVEAVVSQCSLQSDRSAARAVLGSQFGDLPLSTAIDTKRLRALVVGQKVTRQPISDSDVVQKATH